MICLHTKRIFKRPPNHAHFLKNIRHRPKAVALYEILVMRQRMSDKGRLVTRIKLGGTVPFGIIKRIPSSLLLCLFRHLVKNIPVVFIFPSSAKGGKQLLFLLLAHLSDLLCRRHMEFKFRSVVLAKACQHIITWIMMRRHKIHRNLIFLAEFQK